MSGLRGSSRTALFNSRIALAHSFASIALRAAATRSAAVGVLMLGLLPGVSAAWAMSEAAARAAKRSVAFIWVLRFRAGRDGTGGRSVPPAFARVNLAAWVINAGRRASDAALL